jgi:LDH2 family malate/lactate/ureidoglycolate dehydrogenase
MTGAQQVEVRIDDLRDLIQRVFRKLDFDAEAAAQVTDVYMEAELRGHAVQGLEHMIYNQVRVFASRRFNPQGKPVLVKEGPAYALVDGNRGPGQVAAIFGSELAIRKARESGSCTVGITNSQDLYLAGYYPDLIARAGLVGLLFTDGLPLIHATGGAERTVGTNPLAICIPTAGEDPILLDIAMCVSLYGEIHEAARAGRPLRPGLAVGPDGVPTVDPVAAIAGALSPIAGYKGYGLALCIGLLSGPLVGSAVGRATGDSIYAKSALPTGEQSPEIWSNLGKEEFGPAGKKGHLIIAIDPAVFGDPDAFRQGVSAYIDEIKSSKKAPGVSEILVPGERSYRCRRESLERGTIRVSEIMWRDTGRMCAALGVALPDAVETRDKS